MARILIVEVDPDILMLPSVTLRLAGHEVLEAADGLQALAMLDGQRPDLIVTDLTMPRMDGRVLIRRLREDSATASIPILVVSANPHSDVEADSTLGKPFRGPDLLDAAGGLLERGA